MFYVCDKLGNKYGVVDTDDAICKCYQDGSIVEER